MGIRETIDRLLNQAKEEAEKEGIEMQFGEAEPTETFDSFELEKKSSESSLESVLLEALDCLDEIQDSMKAVADMQTSLVTQYLQLVKAEHQAKVTEQMHQQMKDVRKEMELRQARAEPKKENKQPEVQPGFTTFDGEDNSIENPHFPKDFEDEK